MYKNIRRRIVAGLMAFALILANVMLPAAPAFATSGNNGTLKVHEQGTPSGTESNDPKVCVFNFEGFGFDWFQTGYIRIEGQGQTNGTHGDYSFGPANFFGYAQTQYFNDIDGPMIPNGHYKATLYGKKLNGTINLSDEKAKSKVFKIDCVAPVVKDATASVNVTAPTCISAGIASVIGVANASLTSNGGVLDQTVGAHTATFTATDGHAFADGQKTKQVPYTIAAQLAGGQCQQQPADDREERVVEDEPVCTPIGEGTVSFFTEERTRSYTLINNVWTPGEWSEWTKVDGSDDTRPATTEECPLVKVKPGTPQVTDLCGKSNDTYVLPTTDYITYSAVKNGNTVTVTATPDQGYALDLADTTGWTLNQDGTATYTFTFTNIKCDKVTICHRTNSVTNPYRKITVNVNAADGIAGNNGNRADHFDEHQGPIATSEAYAQSLKDNKQKWGDIIPPISGIHEGYNWPTGQAMYENDCDYILGVTPEEPSNVDFCYDDKDYVTVPSATEGYSYFYDGQDVSGQTIAFTGDDISVTAIAKKGYVFPAEAATIWTFTSEDFSNEDCLTITKEFKSVTDTNKDGMISIGDTITWEITVTNTSDNEVFNVIVTDEDVILEDNGYIGNLDSNESRTLTATSTITLEQAAVCKVENIATFSARRTTLLDYSIERFNIITDNEMTPLATGSASDTYRWECAPGQGGETPETPETPEEPETPVVVVLPNTTGMPMQIVLAGVVFIMTVLTLAGLEVKSRLTV